MSTLDHFKINAKAYAALIAAVATGLLGTYGPDSVAGKVLTAVVAVAGAVLVWASRNAEDYLAEDEDPDVSDDLEDEQPTVTEPVEGE